MVHLVPLAGSLLDFGISDIVVRGRHSFVLAPIGVVYSLFNYWVVKSTGEPVYHFLDW